MMQQAPVPTTPATYNNILETDLELKIMEVKLGDETKFQPKFLKEGYNVFLYLAGFQNTVLRNWVRR